MKCAWLTGVWVLSSVSGGRALAEMKQATRAAGAGTSGPELRDIAAPVDVFPYPPWIVVVAGLAAALILALVVWLTVRAIRRRPTAPPPTPRMIAIRELEALRSQIGELTAYNFSIAVSDVLRTFIRRQFGLHAVEQTSPEFLASLQNYLQFSEADRQLLKEFLEKCDMIKFARIEATDADSSQLLTGALDFAQGGRA